MKTYKSKTGDKYLITDGVVNPKYKTVMVQIEPALNKDGKIQTMTVSSLNANWVEVPNLPQESILSKPMDISPPEEKNLKSEPQTKPQGYFYFTTNTNSQGAVPVKHLTMDLNRDFKEILKDMAEHYGGKLHTWETKPRMFAVDDQDGHAKMETYAGKKVCKVRVSSQIVLAGERFERHKSMFDATFTIGYDEQGYLLLDSLVSRSMAHKRVRKQKQSKKKKGGT